ncbi:MAG: ABC transporter substrate-binding protein [Andreesenia angusta]|nr:ABC transporter substrate-binding protein [Andreesenia angusta]
MKRKIIIIGLSLATILSLSACQESENKTETKLEQKTEVEKSNETRIVVDQDGTEVELPKDVEKIADFWHANNQVVLLLGGADKLVTTTTSIENLPWFAKVYPRIKEVPALVKGHDYNVEEVIEKEPDVVIAANDEQVESIRAAGLKAVKVMFQDFDGLKKTVQITSQVIGSDAEKRAKEYIDYLDGNIEYVRERLKDVDKKPKVLHIVGGDDLNKVDGAKSIIGEWMDIAGAENSLPLEANLAEITMEEIIASDPEYIIIGGTESKEGIEKIKNDPAWKDVKAVKDDNLIRNPVGTFNWDRYSAEEALQILWAAKLFHPEKFEDLNMIEKTKDFYKRFYEYELTDEEAEEILAGDPPSN